jgi:hypothetical protein
VRNRRSALDNALIREERIGRISQVESTFGSEAGGLELPTFQSYRGKPRMGIAAPPKVSLRIAGAWCPWDVT